MVERDGIRPSPLGHQNKLKCTTMVRWCWIVNEKYDNGIINNTLIVLYTSFSKCHLVIIHSFHTITIIHSLTLYIHTGKAAKVSCPRVQWQSTPVETRDQTANLLVMKRLALSVTVFIFTLDNKTISVATAALRHRDGIAAACLSLEPRTHSLIQTLSSLDMKKSMYSWC